MARLKKSTKWTRRALSMAVDLGARWVKPHKRLKRWQKALRWSSLMAAIGALSVCFVAFIYAIFLIFTLPNPAELRDLNLTESTLIMDREGNILYAIHGEENREALDELNEISPWLIDATLAIEDDQFYHHVGIDIPALVKAVLSEIGIGTPRGGSTITQQFVKNTFLSSERSYNRKFKEIVLSLWLELTHNKDEILLMYLNAIPYGSNAYGIELAADRYFDKDATELTLAESVILAGIPKAPTRYSPYGNYRYSVMHFELTEEALNGREIEGEQDLEDDEWTRGLLSTEFAMPDGSTFYIKGRSELVLDRMMGLGLISEEEHEDTLLALAEIEFVPYEETIEAPHFVLWVKQILEDKYGAAVVEQGGLKVYTTLHPEFQSAAETAVEERREFNEDNYDASNAAMVSVDPETGQILAMVGSADYFNDEMSGQVNMITSSRQPGSSFKPFVYALSFLNQYTPATVLYDVPTKIGDDEPQNYDGEFWGPMSIRYALAQSRNIPAAKAYFMAGQEDALVPFLKPFGFNNLSEDGNYGWPLALGTAEVTPLELAEAYAVFASGGTHVELTPFLKIENSDGEVLEQWESQDVEKTDILDEQVAFLINDILSDPESGLGSGIRIDSIDNAAKTGTSNKRLSDTEILPNNAWLAAYTPDLVTITWAGNADGSVMNADAGGYNTAAPIWKNYMSAVLEFVDGTEWERPADIEEFAISTASGKLPSDQTPSDMIKTEVFASFAIPTEIDDSYQNVLIETVTNRLATEYSPEDKVEEVAFRKHESILADLWPSWQEDIETWLTELLEKQAEEGTEVDENVRYEQAPTEFASDIHNAITAANMPEIVITDPKSLSSIDIGDKTQEIEVEVESVGNGLEHIEFYMNDKIQFKTDEDPFTGIIRIPSTASDGSILEIRAVIIDIYGYSAESIIELRVEDD